LLVYALIMNNYERMKLDVYNPEICNLFIIAIILLITLASIRKTEIQYFFHKDQSIQLKGLAIIFIILGHLWVHVVGFFPKLLFGGEAVAMFLLLSGYGLTSSYKNRVVLPRVYLTARLNRVMVPYWVITVLIVALDYLILNRTYNLQDIVMTMLGININVNTRYIDYVRWFITFILIWYICFFIAYLFFKDKTRMLFLFLCSVIIFPMDYYITHLGFYQIFAFPLGCAIAIHYSNIESILSRHPRFSLAIAIVALVGVVIYKFTSSIIFSPYLPSIVIKTLDEGISILFCFALTIILAVVAAKGYQSLFLCFMGTISYELFLLHGAFLIKYNPIIIRSESILPLSFSIFLLCITFISWIAHRGYVNAFATREL